MSDFELLIVDFQTFFCSLTWGEYELRAFFRVNFLLNERGFVQKLDAMNREKSEDYTFFEVLIYLFYS